MKNDKYEVGTYERIKRWDTLNSSECVQSENLGVLSNNVSQSLLKCFELILI